MSYSWVLLKEIQLLLIYKGVNVICLTYTWAWWAVIGLVIHAQSKSQTTQSSSDHVLMWVYFTLCQQLTLKSQNSGCILYWRFWPNWWRKFELGIPLSWGATYIRGASYIRDKTVIYTKGPAVSVAVQNFFVLVFSRDQTFGLGLTIINQVWCLKCCGISKQGSIMIVWVLSVWDEVRYCWSHSQVMLGKNLNQCQPKTCSTTLVTVLLL